MASVFASIDVRGEKVCCRVKKFARTEAVRYSKKHLPDTFAASPYRAMRSSPKIKELQKLSGSNGDVWCVLQSVGPPL